MARRATDFIAGVMVGAGAVYASAAARARRVSEGQEGAGGRGFTPRRYGTRAGDIAGLEAATLESQPSGQEIRSLPRIGPRRLAIALRLAGGALVLYSVVRGSRGRARRAARALGMGLLARGEGMARAVLPAESARPTEAGTADRRRIVDVQKTFYIDAPVDQVYSFWSDYEHVPLFMSHIRDVQDLGTGRSRWSVRGPGGQLIEWTSVVTEQRPNKVLAWRSEPDAVLENAAIIRFRPEGTGTRLDLRFCYRPLPGAAGEPAVELLGTDPGVTLNEDLSRLRALLEATARTRS